MSFARNKGRRWSLRARIVICTTAVLAVTLTAAFLWSVYNLRVVLQERNDAALQHEFSEFAVELSQSQSDPASAGPLAAVRHVAQAAKEEGFYVLLQRDGESEALTPGGATRRLQNVPESFVVNESARTFAVPGIPAGVRVLAGELPIKDSRPWILVLGRPLAQTEQTVANFNARLATGGALFLAAAVLGGLFLTRQAIQPVAQSIAAAQRLNPSDLSARLPQTGADDELDKLAATVNDLLDRLEKYHEQITQFTADASHELRGPLAAMRAAIEVGLQESRSTADYHEMLSSLGEQCHRLTDLVNDLLLLAKADAGQIELQRAPVDLAEVVAEVIETYRPLAEEKDVSLEGDGSDRLMCRGDRMRLLQLTMNLVDNAIKFTPRGGNVIVKLGVQESAAVLTVEDTGIGIAADRLSRIFERFYQVDESRSADGSGLGLSICRWVATAHGGTIEATSQPGQGTCLRVAVPRSEAVDVRSLEGSTQASR